MGRGGEIARASGIIILFAILSTILGLWRDILIAANFGTTSQADAYLIGTTIPNFIMHLIIGGAFTSAFIPLFSGYLAKEKEREGWNLASSLLNLSLLIFAILTVLCIFASPILVKLFAPGFSGQTLSLSIKLTRIMLPSMIFFSLATIFKSILNSYNHFTLPAMNPLVLNLSLILMMLIWTNRLGVYALAIGFLLGSFAQALIQLPKLLEKAKGYYRPTLTLGHHEAKTFFALLLPLMVWIVVNQLNILVDRMVASTLFTGSIAAVNFADRIMQTPLSIFGVSVATAAFPSLSSLAATDNRKEFSSNLIISIKMLAYITIPIGACLAIFSTPIIRVLFERGAFIEQSTQMTASTLLFYSLGTPFMAVGYLVIRAFFAMKITKEPVRISILCLTLNIILNIILGRLMGVGGIALATTISEIALLLLLIVNLEEKVEIKKGDLSNFFIKVSIIAILAMGSSFYLFVWLSQWQKSEFLSLSLSLLVGGAIYLCLSFILRLEEVKRLWDLLLKRRR